MLKSINQWGFPEGTPLETIFLHAEQAGYDAVELNLYPSGGTGLTMDTTAQEAEAVLDLASRHSIQLRSLSTGMLWKSPLSAADPDVRAGGREIVTRQLELASLLGMDTVLVVPGAVTPSVTYEECYSRSQEELRELIPLAEQHGVHIGIENVWNKFLLSPMEMARYIDELDSPWAGAYFDIGNVLLFGYPEHWIRTLGERIRKVHVKDFNPAAGPNGFVPLLSGSVNWNEVRRALNEIGYTDTVTAELTPYSADPYQMVYDTSAQLDIITGR
ncbi:sugar phosphate isomerase/epimerase [Paenibacillus sp. Y412MC10]|uniref:sugar phosphate isomerase/epimerase family protein n=1 Tax=Geobacillus sp. (strain Y412MC10) TaxID=481743 RepID=UPI0011A7BF66|nr:sugar phosphate isomerase/epimerase family protein [Paenibacillus sp. Y412MC10]